MTHDEADDFDHPRLPPGHRLRRHVLYRLRAVTKWRVRGTLDHVRLPARALFVALGALLAFAAAPAYAAAARAEVVVELRAPPVSEHAPLTQLRDAARARRPAAPRPPPGARGARTPAARRRAAAAARGSRAAA